MNPIGKRLIDKIDNCLYIGYKPGLDDRISGVDGVWHNLGAVLIIRMQPLLIIVVKKSKTMRVLWGPYA